ncbi:MAG TPA: c-type cytochrome [Gaiellaceae bacterium]|nr:c-type cytochrome [Gaiellaceae bacterium]
MKALVLLVTALALAAPASANSPGVVHARTGAELYAANCARCHGPHGEGYQAPKLQGVGARAADFYLRTGAMPLAVVGEQPAPSRVLFTERELRALIRYVAALGGPPVPTPHPERGSLSEGLKLFTERCAGCHQVAAEGGLVTGARVPPLEDATPRQIAEAVRIGPYLMPRFPESAIPSRKLDSIIRYVEYAKHPDNRGGWSLGELGPVPEGIVAWLVAAVVLVGTCLVIGRRLRM